MGLVPLVGPEAREKLDLYFSLLKDWNAKINLVSRKSTDESLALHFVDSLWICHFAVPHIEGLPVADLGTGAGFPGLVFAVLYPETSIRLYEKLQKRRLFLEEVIRRLDLKNVTLGPAFPELKQRAFLFAKAVFPPAELLEFCRKRLKEGGRAVVNLGGSAEATPPIKGVNLFKSESYRLPSDAGARKLEIWQVDA